MNDSHRPLVTVGVPVYNGERFLEHACEAILAQTLGDIELLIADNASTDRTPEICARLAARDPRVRVIRHEKNIGAPRNWNCLVDQARGEFFKWSTANDWCAPHALEACVGRLQAEPDAVLAYGLTELVDEHGQMIEVYYGDADINMPRPSDRFREASHRLNLNNAMCGVIRTEVLRRTGLDRLYPSGDMALTSELALYGKLRLLPEVLMYRRQSKGTFTSMLSPLQIQRMYDPGAKRPMRLIHGRRHLDNLRCILRAPIGAMERLRALAVSIRLIANDRGHLWREARSMFGIEAAT